MAWDVKNWDRKFTKTNRTQKLTDVLDFHKFKKVRNNNKCNNENYTEGLYRNEFEYGYCI